jgi:Kef-type K+ transport system membrane component KefB
MFFGVRRAIALYWRKAGSNKETLGHNEFSLILLVVLLSALATELLNAHAIFGAFVAGVIMPRDGKLRAAIESRLEDILVVLLLPLFFAFTGLRTNVGLLTTSKDWWLAALILGVAVIGKLGGSALAARASGIQWREASALGVLMNSRGLMELVILTIGLQDGIITPALFTMMVIMAVVTTMMTSPILAWLAPTKKSAT